jgi:amino acid transporter
MPRTGGDYVFVSRILHPDLGFVANFLFTIAFISFIGALPIFFASTAVTVFLATLGQLANNQYFVTSSPWFATSTGEFVTGTTINVILALLIISGRAVWRYLRAIMTITLLGTILNIGFLFLVPTSSFVNSWNALPGINASTSYTGIIQTAIQNGFHTGWTWAGTFAPTALAYAAYTLIGFQLAAYTGGEIKNSKKNVPVTLIGSLLFSAIIFIVWIAAVYNAFGFDFFAGANYLANCGCSSVTLPISTTVNSLFTIIPQNPVLILIEAFCFIGAWIWAAPTNIIPVIRNFFAWSFDRIAPSFLSDVSPRFHTPVKGTILAVLIGEGFLIGQIYTNISAIVANQLIFILIVYLFTSVAAMLLPFRTKEIFQLSPSWVKARILGLPVVTLIGSLSTVFTAFLLYYSLFSPALGYTPASYPWALGFIGVAIVLFYLLRAYRKKQGIDVSLAFKQIPPE